MCFELPPISPEAAVGWELDGYAIVVRPDMLNTRVSTLIRLPASRPLYAIHFSSPRADKHAIRPRTRKTTCASSKETHPSPGI